MLLCSISIPHIKPFDLGLPATVELTFYRTDMCEEALAHCGDDVIRLNARTLQRKVDRITRYEELKF